MIEGLLAVIGCFAAAVVVIRWVVKGDEDDWDGNPW